MAGRDEQTRDQDFNRELGEDFNNSVVDSNIFHFHPYLGNIPNLTDILQMG